MDSKLNSKDTVIGTSLFVNKDGKSENEEYFKNNLDHDNKKYYFEQLLQEFIQDASCQTAGCFCVVKRQHKGVCRRRKFHIRDKISNYKPESGFGLQSETEFLEQQLKLVADNACGQIKRLPDDLKPESEFGLQSEAEYLEKQLQLVTENASCQIEIIRDKFRQFLSERDTTIRALMKENTTLQEEVKSVKEQKQSLVWKLNRALQDAEDIELESEKLKKRLQSHSDTITDLYSQTKALQNENILLRTKLQDVKIHFSELITTCLKISSTMNRDENACDLENENEILKEKIKTIEHEKQRLENELNLTLDQLMNSRDECQLRSNRYEKSETKPSKNALKSDNGDPIVCLEHVENAYPRSVLANYASTPTANCDSRTLAIGSNNGCSVNHNTTEKNIYQITAQNVYMLDKANVKMDVGNESYNLLDTDYNEQLETDT